MSYENKPLTGVLFKQEPKTEKHPDFKGRVALVDGTEVELAGWFARDKSTGKHRKDKNGNRWINLRLGSNREPREVREAPQPTGDDDSCPF